MARTFTAANDSSIAEMQRAANLAIPAGRPTFIDTGFKTDFRDGSNLVRHFTAGFIAGARLGVVGYVGCVNFHLELTPFSHEELTPPGRKKKRVKSQLSPPW